jgi:hypothetical protein
MTTDGTSAISTGLLAKLSANDRERLGEALRRLLAHGSILGLEPAQTDLYHWCYQNRAWVDELKHNSATNTPPSSFSLMNPDSPSSRKNTQPRKRD